MSQGSDEPNATQVNTVKCSDCGANLKFAPGTHSLKCEYCSAENTIDAQKTALVENDYESYLNDAAGKEETQSLSTVGCGNCGASTTLPPNVTSGSCPYCDTPVVVTNASTCSLIRPKYLLPFKVDREKAKDEFAAWVKSLWFAPNKLTLYARQSAEKLKGVYLPYWTYDSSTSSQYSGARGEYYYETEQYRDSNGNLKTRSVRKTAWYPASGTVSHHFDDLLVCAANSLPRELTRKLEPWDLPELVPYNDQFLAGFVTESYQVQLKEGFEEAKDRMAPVIENLIRQDIGGDTQRIDSVSTSYSDIRFKHILLPLWISAYRYNEKVYRFTVNARSGEVQGERPYSIWKILFLVLGILAAIATGIYLYKTSEDTPAESATESVAINCSKEKNNTVAAKTSAS